MADHESGTLDEIVFRGRTALDQREFEVLMEQYKLLSTPPSGSWQDAKSSTRSFCP